MHMAEAKKPGRGRIYDSITETVGDTPRSSASTASRQ
jgi:hypothetical protein